MQTHDTQDTATVKRRPCPTCPWRATTPRGGFPGGIIDVRRLARMLHGELMVMQCHCTPDGAGANVCVGFALQVGPDCVGYRLAAMLGAVDHDALESDAQLLSLDELAARHGGTPT